MAPHMASSARPGGRLDDDQLTGNDASFAVACNQIIVGRSIVAPGTAGVAIFHGILPHACARSASRMAALSSSPHAATHAARHADESTIVVMRSC